MWIESQVHLAKWGHGLLLPKIFLFTVSAATDIYTCFGGFLFVCFLFFEDCREDCGVKDL